MSELLRTIRRHESGTGAPAPEPIGPIPIERVAVVGAGVMGSGIAQVLAVAGYAVRLHDLDSAALARAIERIETGRFGLARGVERGKLTADAAAAARDRITTTADLAVAGADADLVLEAVYEDLALKVRVFGELDRIAPPGAILASNTSGYPISALAGATRRPALVIGWHWASPPPVMALAEIVVHAGTADAAREAVVAIARRAGKNPQVVRDQPTAWGFVANRVLKAVIEESERIVAEEVATREQVDALLRDCFRWPVGPFEMVEGARRGWA
jgi:3-hydroxyacyl-CoA dehydrogenase